MDNDIYQYFLEQYEKLSFRVVPGHWPNFKSKEEVDQWINKKEYIIRIALEDN